MSHSGGLSFTKQTVPTDTGVNAYWPVSGHVTHLCSFIHLRRLSHTIGYTLSTKQYWVLSVAYSVKRLVYTQLFAPTATISKC